MQFGNFSGSRLTRDVGEECNCSNFFGSRLTRDVCEECNCSNFFGSRLTRDVGEEYNCSNFLGSRLTFCVCVLFLSCIDVDTVGILYANVQDAGARKWSKKSPGHRGRFV